MKVLWKTYYWLITISILIYFIFTILQTPLINLGLFVEFLEVIFSYFAVYCYVFKAKFFSSKIWTIYLCWSLLMLAIFTLGYENSIPSFLKVSYLKEVSESEPFTLLESIIIIAFSLPIYVASFRLSKGEYLK